MPEPMDRETFLAHVASTLDIPPDAAGDAIDELRDHIDEASSDLRAAGIARDEAERRAVGRLGDPRRLGRDLTSAHRARRPLFAYVGGIVRATIGTAIWSYLFVLVTAIVAVGLAFPLASWVLSALGRTWSSMFSSPGASVAWTVLAGIGVASAAWTLPARLSVLTGRRFEAVRRWVAAVGLVGGSAWLWVIVDLSLDRVLAVGLPLLPIVFALVALRAPSEPRFRHGIVPALALGALLVLPISVVAVLTTTDARAADWSADLSVFGRSVEEAGIEGDVSVARSLPTLGREIAVQRGHQVQYIDLIVGSHAGVPVLSSVQAEVVPVTVVGDSLQFGAVALGTAGQRITAAGLRDADGAIRLGIDVLVPRDPVPSAVIVTGTLADGSRVLLDADLNLEETPPWHGTLWEWWLGAP